jgi:neurotransmitter:Na+ symporter, NSS family
MEKSMPSKSKEFFTSRWGLLLSMMGVAVGAGNIWRFSRVVAQNGGGAFIIPWVIFLFVWSIPLIIAEIAMGKLCRRAPIGAMGEMAGRKFAWMGAFIALVTTGILFYYSVVVGWGCRYFFYSITGYLTATDDHVALWNGFIHSFQPVFFHCISILMGCWIIYKGVTKGIERSNKILIPALFAIIILIAIRAVTLPGAWNGIVYLLTPNLQDLLNYRVWLEALTQNAWDTGAGWGLLLVYAGYAHRKESVIVNGSLTALSNNAVSLVMAVIIFSTAFALEEQHGLEQLISGQGATNTGLTFIYLPRLFQALPGGPFIQATFASIFFCAFVCAAISSMISMLQLTMQVFHEMGLGRKSAIVLTASISLAFGIPSALSMAFFENQDWVWSVGLIVNGLFLAFGIMRYGIDRFRQEAINSSAQDFKVGKFYNGIIAVLIPLQGIALLFWYCYNSITSVDTEWWNPLHTYSIGTLLFQWGIAFIIFIFLNRWIAHKTLDIKHEH